MKNIRLNKFELIADKAMKILMEKGLPYSKGVVRFITDLEFHYHTENPKVFSSAQHANLVMETEIFGHSKSLYLNDEFSRQLFHFWAENFHSNDYKRVVNEGGKFQESCTPLLKGDLLDNSIIIKHLTLPKVECKTCGAKILRITAQRTSGMCMPCFKDYLDFLFFVDANTDEKLRESMIQYINDHALNIESWEYTKIGSVHSEILKQGIKSDNPVISFYLNQYNWWLATTEDVVGKYKGNNFEFKPKYPYFVVNIEPLIDGRPIKTEVFEIITTGESTVVRFLVETRAAITAPFSYFRYWMCRKSALEEVNKYNFIRYTRKEVI